MGVLFHADAEGFTLSVTGSDQGNVGAYRWLLEEDRGFHPENSPGFPNPSDRNVLGLNLHPSYMPVVSKGEATGDTEITVPDPTKYYFVSVLPKTPETYSLGGASVKPGQTAVTVNLNKLPLPTAQISVFVFEDTQLINGAPDLPQERGLEGFIVNIREAAGRYGANGELITQDAFGRPLGTIKTDANGLAIVKNLPPGKYGVTITPPLGEGWIQTSTIEGSPTIDAWVKAKEPPYFAELGVFAHHGEFGFLKAMKDVSILSGGFTVSGKVVDSHLSRPPDITAYSGPAFPEAWVGLNDASTGKGIYAQPCNADSTFVITDVPPGAYQLVIWDINLDIIIHTIGLTVNADGTCGAPGSVTSCALGDITVNDWFAHLQGTVFLDVNRNGFKDAGEPGLQGRTVNLRFRDGSMYNSATTGPDGGYEFAEIFPFFHWQVAEVDFANLQATGATVVVDGGGPVDTSNENFPGFGRLNPQQQTRVNPNTGDLLSRTQRGPVLTQAFAAFAGQTSVIDWGKTSYLPGKNGGISGIVFYDTTRAENDPVTNFGEGWQPGIPGVTVRLYDSTGTLLLNETQTDSWDDSIPRNCPGDPADPYYRNGKCYDGMRNWNQVRPGVFDGGYAFDSYFPGGMNSGNPEVKGLPSGQYVVEIVPPVGYEVVRSQDKNVDFGDNYRPSPLALPPPCVGDTYVVPAELSLFPGTPAPLAGQTLNHCNRKQVDVISGKNTAGDFFLFTEVPVAAHISGQITNDVGNNVDPNDLNFGEKFTPPWLPVAFYDYNGKEITRVHSDQYGKFSALVPSTYSVNVPSPSGVSPAMLIACMNDAGPIPDPNNPGQFIIDPMFRRNYNQFCYTFQYMPGAITYLDTPVLPISAFADQTEYPLDCELPDETPVIHSVTQPGNGVGGGPYVPARGTNLNIISLGQTEVLNPAFGQTGAPRTIFRDYGFGANPGGVTLNGVNLPIVTWSDGLVSVRIPPGAQTGDLQLTRGDNDVSTVMGVTVTVGPIAGTVRAVGPNQRIQAAINSAQPGDLILVAPGVHEEMVILYKDVQLQGWGAPSVTINAVRRPGEKIQAWRTRVNNIVSQPGTQYLLPGQTLVFDPLVGVPGLLNTAEGPGVLVLADQLTWSQRKNPRIDGITITGADIGGAVVLNGYAAGMEISNNRLISNHGLYAGGIRVGHPDLVNPRGFPVSARNRGVQIHHNHIAQNGCTDRGAGGIGLFTGATGYSVTDNYICGNFTTGSGGGIGHLGRSHHSLRSNVIARNKILFNQSFIQTPGAIAEGGGISIAGLPRVGGTGLTLGAGSVDIDSNLIQGNMAGAGDGGGISLRSVNGAEVAANPGASDQWFSIGIYNNMIMNNIAGLSAGGISIKDAVSARIINNSIVHNDSTATAGDAFPTGLQNPSGPRPAGVVSHAHSPSLAALVDPDFSNPNLVNNILWQNRSMYYDPNLTNANGVRVGGLVKAFPEYQDLAVLGIVGQLDPGFCLLTSTAGYGASNVSGAPRFVSSYFNGPSDLPAVPGNTVPLTGAAGDEGGNFIDVRFGPLSLVNPATGALYGDLHLGPASAATNTGSAAVLGVSPLLNRDFEGDPRPIGAGVDIGADE
jgi:hypothetical protein